MSRAQQPESEVRVFAGDVRENSMTTSTSNFGVGLREGHDASKFYERFRAPQLSDDDTVLEPAEIEDPFLIGDARHMDAIADGSVALVVTSPPYFAGKQYEEELGRDGVPASYLEYLEMLREVFAECVRKLEPGGRMAVNVANLGRKPYRSLSADVIRILEDDLGLLLRGEIIWRKAEGASGNCAWGSFRSASNPVLRDITERVIVASKGRFDRALTARQRKEKGRPHESTVMTDDFMALTLDVWTIPPESARRVGHPAPFPVELPEQLIRLYTYRNDLVVDPFMGSGSALVAAANLDRRYAGYDLDPDYVEIARRRVAEAVGTAHRAVTGVNPSSESDSDAQDRHAPRARKVISAPVPDDDGDFQRRAGREGKAAQKLAREVLEDAGFTVTATNKKIRGTGVTINYVAEDRRGEAWYFDVSGAFTSHRGGLLRTDTLWKCLGRAHALRGRDSTPLVFLTTDLPRRGSEGDTALRAAGTEAFFDAIEMLSDDGRSRLELYAIRGSVKREPGFWLEQDLA